MKHLLINYSFDCSEKGHIDPDFTHLVYGDSKLKGKSILNHANPGSYAFFNTTINGIRYITAYFYIDKILSIGKDDIEISNLKCSAREDEVIILGNRYNSKILTHPLPLNKELFISLDKFKDNEFKEGKSELSTIASSTRSVVHLDEGDKNLLLEKCKNRG
ncbi:hypothetical protein [Faecalimicrobium dakarense]|uniref:hypothetical protein n=1 Tax=Faecalimicrobium dakarense TaxID=1301100 RepID=UPI0004BA0713|nr:hypothetical protein [[Clostridium] dakarense]